MEKKLAEMIKCHKLWLRDPTMGQQADLRRANLQGANLCRADLRGADLRSADLSEADLSEADLYKANLYKADLYKANLYKADLRRADLRDANLSDAYLNWNSHDLLAELLSREMGYDAEHRQLVGLILISRDMCWNDFLKLKHSAQEWALSVLVKYVRDGDYAPDFLRRRKL